MSGGRLTVARTIPDSWPRNPDRPAWPSSRKKARGQDGGSVREVEPYDLADAEACPAGVDEQGRLRSRVSREGTLRSGSFVPDIPAQVASDCLPAIQTVSRVAIVVFEARGGVRRCGRRE